MSESEKRLREWLKTHPGLSDVTRKNRLDELDTLLSEHRAEMAAARDEALEEVAQMMETWPHLSDSLSADYEDANTRVARRIRALRSKPAQSIPVAKVRDVLAAIYNHEKQLRERVGDARSARYANHSGRMGAAYAAARNLGLPLDAEHDASAPESERCVRCGNPRSEHGPATKRIIGICWGFSPVKGQP